jgi:hypothetical protein
MENQVPKQLCARDSWIPADRMETLFSEPTSEVFSFSLYWYLNIHAALKLRIEKKFEWYLFRGRQRSTPRLMLGATPLDLATNTYSHTWSKGAKPYNEVLYLHMMLGVW